MRLFYHQKSDHPSFRYLLHASLFCILFFTALHFYQLTPISAISSQLSSDSSTPSSQLISKPPATSSQLVTTILIDAGHGEPDG